MSSSTQSSSTQVSLRLSLCAIGLALTAALPAAAATLSYTGDTTAAPTFSRPAVPGFEGLNTPISSLSPIGTDVAYVSQLFSVDTTGSYNITGSQNFDAIQLVYQTLFNPTDPLTNVIAGVDPFPDTGNASFFGIPLTGGTQYILVTTGFDNPDRGTFTNTISGPGAITLNAAAAVPEPSEVGGVAIALVGGGWLLKRKLKQR
jgi:hypothetical protein